jgi:hypothetical protein
MDFEVLKIKGLNLKYKQSIAANKIEDNSTPQTRYKLQLGEMIYLKLR